MIPVQSILTVASGEVLYKPFILMNPNLLNLGALRLVRSMGISSEDNKREINKNLELFDKIFLYDGKNDDKNTDFGEVNKDLEKSRLFYEKILGLQVTAEAEKQIFLRGMEERTHHSLILEEGDSAKVESLSFRLKSEGELDKAASYFKKIGCEFEWVERPFQGKTLRTLEIGCSLR